MMEELMVEVMVEAVEMTLAAVVLVGASVW